MGSFFGGLLSARNEVTLIGRADHVRTIRRHGLRISGKTVRITKPRAYVRIPQYARPDLVIVSTKAYDTPKAMRQLRPFAKSAIFLTLQNGLDNAEIIGRIATHVVAGTTAHGVTFLGPGEIRHAGVGETILGPWANVDEGDLVRLRDVFEEAGITTRLAIEVRSELWAKVIVNASINPLAALAGVPNGRLVRDKRLLATLEAVCRESAAVAKAEGAGIDADEIVQRTVLVARRTAANRSSMLQDLDHGRRTEIDAITGAILRSAVRERIAAPLNQALFALVKAREAAIRTAD